MNILHISDLHYDGENRKLDSVLSNIVKVLKKENKNVDFIIFTGDLVQSGTVKDNFNAAKKRLFDFLCSELNVNPENVIFTSGNHDIDRQAKHPAIGPYFQMNINSSKELDAFYNKKDRVFQDSILPLASYNEFLKSYHTSNKNNIIKELYSIHYRKFNNKKIAFVCLSTAWLSTLWDEKGEKDIYNLCFPVSALNEITKTIHGQVDRTILLMHHPIVHLKNEIAFDLGNSIYDNFDMLFVGHVHKMMNTVRYNGCNGIYEHTAKATLAKGDNLGCSFIENDEDQENAYYVSEITYVKDSNECHFGSATEIIIPVGEEKAEQIRLRGKIHELIPIAKDEANNLLLVKSEDTKNNFLSSFNVPYIKTQKEDALNSNIANTVTMQELYDANTNFVLFGKDKCGKTSILKRIQLEYLMHFSTYQRIPLYLDVKQEEANISDDYDLEKVLNRYLQVNKALAKGISESERLVLLVDNFRPSGGFCNYLQEFIKSHDKCVVILTTEDNTTNSYEIESLDFIKNGNYRKVFFHDLRRQEIIKYTDEQLSGSDKKSEIQDRIIKLCKQMELPCNFWTISLLVLIHHKSSDTYSKNLFAILDLCVDEIFEKKRLLMDGTKITFDQLKKTCASLAAYLFEYHETEVYSATKDEICSFLSSEFDKNIRITATPYEVFDFFLACGMLKSAPKDRYVFRLNGFFEYFLAFHMTKDVGFKNRIISDDVKYLGFKNQLEIYSGFKNDDTEILNLVYQKAVTKCSPLFKKYDVDKDNQLLKSIDLPKQVEESCKELSITKALSPLEKAEIEDFADGTMELKSEVHLMKRFDPKSTSIDVVERFLSILARVFKNIDTVTDDSLDISQIFRVIVDYYCDFGFYLVDEIARETKEEIKQNKISFIDESDELKLLKLFSNFTPIISQTQLFDALGHYSLEKLIKKEIENYRLTPSNNQYKLFILYFTLFDIDLTDNYQMIDNAISDINKMPILRYMMLLKLNYYLAFKADGNKQLEQFLQNRIQRVKVLLDNKTNVELLQKGLSDTRKTAMINKKGKK